jgi:hypothetical protein
MIKSFEPEENKQDMEDPKENQPIILPKPIKLPLDFSLPNGEISRQGISWLIQILFQDPAETSDELSLILKRLHQSAWVILNSSSLAEGLDIFTKEGLNEFNSRLTANKNSAEWWAAQVMYEINDLIKNVKIEDKETQKALWKMYKIVSSNSMLIFKDVIERTFWCGHMINNLKNVLKVWDDNKENENCNEEFWQKIFRENSIILSQVFSFPVIFIEDKGYVGGKSISNAGGKVVDFLLKNDLTKNIALVEIKTPKTKIIGGQYRSSVYSISGDITGAIIQISDYKDSLTKEYYNLIGNMEEKINAFNPQCMVIAGNAQVELVSKEHIKSFELFRSGLKDVQLITYDELFHKIEILIKLLEENNEVSFE